MTEDEILRKLRGLTTLKPFTIVDLHQRNGPDVGLDAVLRLAYDGVERDFGVEVKARSVARYVREAARQAKKYANGDLLPLVVCPYLRPDLAQELLEERVSAVDLCGNLAVVVPGVWYVERLGAPNLYPETHLVKNPYRGTSSLVPRLLVMGERFATAKDLIERVEQLSGSITKPTVSKVLRQLEADGMVERQPEIRASNRARLLDLLATNYQPPAASQRLKGSVENLSAWRPCAAERAARTGARLVGVAPERYTIFPSSYEELTVYTDSADTLLEGSNFKEGDRWPNLTVIETDDPTVYFASRVEDGFPWCPPLEVFLELRTGDKRERETADALGKRLLIDPTLGRKEA